jgi:hypothetical protein
VSYAAGVLHSTVENLYRWDRVLYDEQLLSPELREAMFTPYVETPLGDHGYGWFVTWKDGRRVLRHGGGGDGFVAVVERDPGDEVALILLSNGESTDIGAIADAVDGIVFGG